jgi:hypothetical protein
MAVICVDVLDATLIPAVENLRDVTAEEIHQKTSVALGPCVPCFVLTVFRRTTKDVISVFVVQILQSVPFNYRQTLVTLHHSYQQIYLLNYQHRYHLIYQLNNQHRYRQIFQPSCQPKLKPRI